MVSNDITVVYANTSEHSEYSRNLFCPETEFDITKNSPQGYCIVAVIFKRYSVQKVILFMDKSLVIGTQSFYFPQFIQLFL